MAQSPSVFSWRKPYAGPMTRLRDVLGSRVLVGDGAMGTMLQAFDLSLADFDDLEGCNEVLNRTRPDVVSAVHRVYLEAGADWIETNTFGANHAALTEYGIVEQLFDLAKRGAQLARSAADEFSTPEHPRFVIGSVGPGTKLPTLGHIDFATLRDAYHQQVAAMIEGGADAVLVETCQDLLQAKAAIIGAKRARAAADVDLPIWASITIETTGTMLLGSEIGAAMTTLEALGIDVIGLNCATGPAEMGEHLRYLARHSRVQLAVMPNAGLPELTPTGAVYPLGPSEFAQALTDYADRYGLASVAGCCGTTPEHIRTLASAIGSRAVTARDPQPYPAVSSLYADVTLRQDTSYLAVGERTNANGSKAFREAMLAGNWQACVDIGKEQSSEGAHLTDLCVDYVGRDGVADMAELAGRFATALTLPVMLDSTEPEVISAGLEKLPGRSIINSVNFEDGDGPGSRYARVMPSVVEHGAAVVALTIDERGQARTADWKIAVAERLIADLTGRWGLRESDILVDCLTFPIGTGQEETRRDGVETLEAIRRLKQSHPEVGTTLGVSNVSFGLNPAARMVLNSVFLDECVKVGLDSAIINPARITPVERIPEDQRLVALDLIYDRRREDYDPLARFLELFEGVTASSMRAERDAALAALPLPARLSRRIIDGNDKGLLDDLDEALSTRPALQIINEDLLSGMREVGELFGAGRMQLPFVLASAEVMKRAVAHLEPHIDKVEGQTGKGTLVIATVKGDVHDIGKNLVDIIVSNNGYTVINIGIKQPVSAIIEAAEAHNADVIGMSGLLVKSTVVMKDNLIELAERGLAEKYPVILGGAALTRTFVERDLQEVFPGTVRYAKDAFEGLALMDALMAIKRGETASLPEPRQRRISAASNTASDAGLPTRSEVARRIDVPTPPFWGSRVAKGITLADVASWLDERALFMGRWGLRGTRDGVGYHDLVATDGAPRLRRFLERIQTDSLAQFGVVYGYYPVYSSGNTLVVLDPDDPARELTRFDFPRQQRDRRLCLADFFRDETEAAELGPDVLGLQLVTMGSAVSEATQRLFEEHSYRDYLELHGLSVQLTESLAELWHHRMRAELGLADSDGSIEAALRDQAYRGSRYSFGYPACPDLADRAKIVQLLRPDRIGVELSEEFQLVPEQATDALIVHHPEAKYFNAS